MLRLLAPRRIGRQCSLRAVHRKPSYAVCAINNRRQSNPQERGNIQAVKLHLAAQRVWAGKPLLESVASQLIDGISMHTSSKSIPGYSMPVIELVEKPRISSQLLSGMGTNDAAQAFTSTDALVQQLRECIEQDTHAIPLLTYHDAIPAVISLNANNLLMHAAQLMHMGEEPAQSLDAAASMNAAKQPVLKMAIARSASANTKVAIATDMDATKTVQPKAAATIAATEAMMLPQQNKPLGGAFSGPAFDSASLQHICHDLFQGLDEINQMKLEVALHLIDAGEPIPWENTAYKKQHLPSLASLGNLKPKSKLSADRSECFVFTKEDGKELLGLNASKLIAAWNAHISGKPITSTQGTTDAKPKQTAKSAAVLDAVNVIIPAGKPAAELIASLPVTAEPEPWLFNTKTVALVTPFTLPWLSAMVDTVFAGSEYTQQLKREAGLWIALTSASLDSSTDDARPPHSLEWDNDGHNGLALTKMYKQARQPDQPETAKAVFEADLCFSFVHAGGKEWLTLSTNALQMQYAQLTATAFEPSVPLLSGLPLSDTSAVTSQKAVRKRASPRRTTPALPESSAVSADDVQTVKKRSSPRRTASPAPETATIETVEAVAAEEKVVKKRASQARSITPAVVGLEGVINQLSLEQAAPGRASTPEVTTVAFGVDLADVVPKAAKKRASSRRTTPAVVLNDVADVEEVTKAKAKRRTSPRKSTPAVTDATAALDSMPATVEPVEGKVKTRRRRSTSPPVTTENVDIAAVPVVLIEVTPAAPAAEAVLVSASDTHSQVDAQPAASSDMLDEEARVIAKAAALRKVHRVLRARSKELQQQQQASE